MVGKPAVFCLATQAATTKLGPPAVLPSISPWERFRGEHPDTSDAMQSVSSGSSTRRLMRFRNRTQFSKPSASEISCRSLAVTITLGAPAATHALMIRRSRSSIAACWIGHWRAFGCCAVPGPIKTTVAVFVQPNPDKRRSFHKKLSAKAEVKEFKPLQPEATKQLSLQFWKAERLRR